ncbi:MAG: hypothetical protein H6Q17_1736 [Bacteroidetes bacterium]|nr:hypothetical protein [Bacteroidota bacterium]
MRSVSISQITLYNGYIYTICYKYMQKGGDIILIPQFWR